jgi:hypothetical protein
MNSRSEAPKADASVIYFFIAFFPLREVDGASYRPSGGIHGCGFDRRGLGGHSDPKILTANPNLDPNFTSASRCLPAWSVGFLTDGCEKLYNNPMPVLDPFRSSAVRYGL